jgi:hypothetical protein
VIVVTSRRHCLQAESHAAVVSSPVIDAGCSKLYSFGCVFNCPDDGGSTPLRIFSSLMSLCMASYPTRVVYWFSLRDLKFSQWCCWKDASPRMLALSLLGEWFGRTVVILSLVSSSPKRVIFLPHCTWDNKRTQRIRHKKDEECSYVHSSQWNEVNITSIL